MSHMSFQPINRKKSGRGHTMYELFNESGVYLCGIPVFHPHYFDTDAAIKNRKKRIQGAAKNKKRAKLKL
jgi:hypothetical protein